MSRAHLGLVVPGAQVDKVVGAHGAVELVAGHREPVLVRHGRLQQQQQGAITKLTIFGHISLKTGIIWHHQATNS